MSVPPLSRVLRRLSWLCCLALALSLSAAYGRHEPATLWLEPVHADLPFTPPVSASAPLAQGQERLYLPLMQYPPGPPTLIGFGSGIRGGQLIGEAGSFAFGFTTLAYRVEVVGGAGRSFRERWTIDGVARPELSRSGVLPEGQAVYLSAIALSTGAPLPRGQYRLQLLVGGLIGGEGRAAIR